MANKKIRASISGYDWASLGLIFAASVLAFLPLVGKLGYYHDDWFTTIAKVSGVNLFRMHLVDRPVLGLWYAIVDFILGEAPIAWHLYSPIMRFVGSIGLLWLVRMIWPHHKAAGTMIALLYTIYPGFLQQPSANNYSNIIFIYSLSIYSLVFTVQAIYTTRRWLKILLTILAVGISAFYLMAYEALIGLEIFRFVLIWTLLARNHAGSFRNTILNTLKKFSPYLLVAGLFVVWRLFFFTSSRQSTDTSLLLKQYVNNPFIMAVQVGVGLIKDLFETVVGAWIIPGYQLGINARPLTTLLAIILSLCFVGLVLFFIRNWGTIDQSSEPQSEMSMSREATTLGLVGVLVTLLPVALTGRDVQFRIFLDRYTYQSIVPAAMLITGLFYLTLRQGWQYRIMTVLVFLAIYTHVINASGYAKNWDLQKQVWWQMSWRAPGFLDGTTLVIQMPPGYRYPEDFEIWAPASRIYFPSPGPLKITAEVLNAETLPAMLARDVTGRNYRGVVYNRDFNQAVISSIPSENSCLHVLDGLKPEISSVEDPLVIQVAGISRLDRIKTQGSSPILPKIIFGNEPDHGWCYTYQKASLARQNENWIEVAQLGDESFSSGQGPGDLVEYAPFLEAYLHLNRLQEAENLAAKITASEPKTTQLLCKNYLEAKTTSDLEIAEQAISILCQK